MPTCPVPMLNFRDRTGMAGVHLSQNGPRTRWKHPAHGRTRRHLERHRSQERRPVIALAVLSVRKPHAPELDGRRHGHRCGLGGGAAAMMGCRGGGRPRQRQRHRVRGLRHGRASASQGQQVLHVGDCLGELTVDRPLGVCQLGRGEFVSWAGRFCQLGGEPQSYLAQKRAAAGQRGAR
jgi:hypothetical protein